MKSKFISFHSIYWHFFVCLILYLHCACSLWLSQFQISCSSIEITSLISSIGKWIYYLKSALSLLSIWIEWNRNKRAQRDGWYEKHSPQRFFFSFYMLMDDFHINQQHWIQFNNDIGIKLSRTSSKRRTPNFYVNTKDGKYENDWRKGEENMRNIFGGKFGWNSKPIGLGLILILILILSFPFIRSFVLGQQLTLHVYALSSCECVCDTKHLSRFTSNRE